MKQPDYSIAVLRGDGVFGQLHGEWNELWEACPDATEAQTFSFQQLYRKHVARREQLLSVTARDGAGKLAALGVFAVRRDRMTLQRRFGFLGEHDVDYHCMLYRAGLPEAVGRDMLQAALKAASSVPVLEVLNVPNHSWTKRALDLVGIAAAGFNGSPQTRLSDCYTIALPPTMDDYWATLDKSARDRLQNKSKLRKLLREHEVEFRCTTGVDDLPTLLDEVEAVERARWGATNKFGDGASRNFLRAMIAGLVKEQRCRIFTLRVDGICRAYIVGFCLRGAFRIPYLAHDPSMPGNFSLSLICNVMAIEQCILDGFHEYDLTRGSEGYKAHLGGGLRQNFSNLVYRNGTSERLAGINQRMIAPLLHHHLVRKLRHLVRG